MRILARMALGALSVGVIALASAPRVDARNCCHGRHDCPMMSGRTADAPRPGPVSGRTYDPSTVSTLRAPPRPSSSCPPAEGGKVVKLRDEQGVPLWSGSRRP